MNLYRISQKVNNDYDTYDSAVVAAEDAYAARRICPNTQYKIGVDDRWHYKGHDSAGYRASDTWCEIKDVKIEIIGLAAIGVEKGVIVASFNAAG